MHHTTTADYAQHATASKLPCHQTYLPCTRVSGVFCHHFKKYRLGRLSKMLCTLQHLKFKDVGHCSIKMGAIGKCKTTYFFMLHTLADM